jgi:hypothetical protein
MPTPNPDDLGLGLPRAASPLRRILVASAVAVVCAAVPVAVMTPQGAPTGIALRAGSNHASRQSVPIVKAATGIITTPVTSAAGASAPLGLGAASSSAPLRQARAELPTEVQPPTASLAIASSGEALPTHVALSGAALARVFMRTGGATATMLAHVASSATHRAAPGARTITTDLRRVPAPARRLLIETVRRLQGTHGRHQPDWARRDGLWHPGHAWRHVVSEERHHRWAKATDGRAGYRRGHGRGHGHAGWAVADRRRHGGWWGRDGDHGGRHHGRSGDHRHRHAD